MTKPLTEQEHGGRTVADALRYYVQHGGAKALSESALRELLQAAADEIEHKKR
jgi:hypothetical protein